MTYDSRALWSTGKAWGSPGAECVAGAALGPASGCYCVQLVVLMALSFSGWRSYWSTQLYVAQATHTSHLGLKGANGCIVTPLVDLFTGLPEATAYQMFTLRFITAAELQF